jgi:hypothetical protein
VLFLSACAAPSKTINISSKPVDKPELVLPTADVLNLREVQWIIITPENVDQIMKSLSANDTKVAVFALTDKGYQNLSLNINDLRTYVQQMQAIIVAYEGYYKNSNSALDAANAKIESAGAEAKPTMTQQRKKIFGVF